MSQPSPASGFKFAAHRVLANPELLGIIFSFGTRASNVSYALVCRGWRESALDNVWREVDDIYYLLQLLAPLRTRNSTLEFTRIPTPEDWTRFIPYARRVHSLKCGIKLDEKSHWLSLDSVFYVLALYRTTLEVFPNLRSLWWNSNPRHASLFMHDKVTEFIFQINSENLPSLRTDIVGRMPSLRSLGWTNSYPSGLRSHKPNDDQELLQLISSLPKLREIAPAKGALGGKFLKTLSSLLPELEAIRSNNLNEMRFSTSPLKCTLQEGDFPKLYELCLKSYLGDIRVYLTGGALLPRLRNLSVEGGGIAEQTLEVQQFLTDVTRCYPTLEMVSMNLMVNAEEEYECYPLSPEHLNPILSLKQLTRLELRHNHPLQISEVDLAEFGAALPAVEKLVLNPEPFHLTRPEITLHSLLIVAQHFPNLFYLGIYLDAQDSATPMPYLPAKTRLFPRLLTLHMGVSPIASEVPVTMFLSHILSENGGWKSSREFYGIRNSLRESMSIQVLSPSAAVHGTALWILSRYYCKCVKRIMYVEGHGVGGGESADEK
ncbi:hypothetical protein BGY98DRAFT_85930 [Russula aff. rugulosa BPL654]|nr:hypothetical protein BGY98DRAFT_85930 [Russula aff. rugulosa BPL654]